MTVRFFSFLIYWATSLFLSGVESIQRCKIFLASGNLPPQRLSSASLLKSGHFLTPWSLRPGEAIRLRPVPRVWRIWLFFVFEMRINQTSTVCSSQFDPLASGRKKADIGWEPVYDISVLHFSKANSWEPGPMVSSARFIRTKSVTIRKRHLSRASTFGVVRRALQTKGILLAVDLEDGRVLRRSTHRPTLAVTTWLIVS